MIDSYQVSTKRFKSANNLSRMLNDTVVSMCTPKIRNFIRK
jgi:hypothetical protein